MAFTYLTEDIIFLLSYFSGCFCLYPIDLAFDFIEAWEIIYRLTFLILHHLKNTTHIQLILDILINFSHFSDFPICHNIRLVNETSEGSLSQSFNFPKLITNNILSLFNGHKFNKGFTIFCV